MNEHTNIPFSQGQKLFLKNKPSELVEFTGEIKQIGKNVYIFVRAANGTRKMMLIDTLLPVEEKSQEPLEQIRKGCYGSIVDLKRLVTFEKLKGTLNEIVYSMEAARVDFYPHQFKPVLKFIDSPMHRLVLADEVGLGKTIESGLIWMEMQARHQAKRLLVVCPPTLAEKWEMELKEKFLVDALRVDFVGFNKRIEEFEQNRQVEEFALITTYSALRPPKSDKEYLRNPPDEDEAPANPKTRLLQKLNFWSDTEVFPFDLVIFDEAHYMRNTATAAYQVGKALSAASQGVLFVSATPINNKSQDLQSLLSLIDSEFFVSQGAFETLVHVNRPTIHASICLSRSPINRQYLRTCIEGMKRNDYISDSPHFLQLKKCVSKIESQENPSIELVSQAQEYTEKLNILGSYISRTLRKQVEEHRPTRSPHVFNIEYTPLERAFYDNIKDSIRISCQNIPSGLLLSRINHQLMAASSLPAYAERLLCRQNDDDDNDSIFEVFGEEVNDENQSKDTFKIALKNIPNPEELAACDTKFTKLMDIIKKYGNERIVIFAYYHGTLRYLFRRLRKLGIKVGMISGKNSMEERWEEIKRFINGDIQIIISSEVGSEGLDLQCAHILINYDMPWNPMRVEQRIGRIDRVGQESKKLYIINFNIDNTIGQRVYQILHKKINIFSSTLGDMEDILGSSIRELTKELFTKCLSEEEENQRIQQTAQALYNKMKQLQQLEEQSTELLGLSDYIQRRIEEGLEKGRYIHPDELKSYLQNFFGSYFRGTLIQPDTPARGCMRLALSHDARNSLDNFIRNDSSRSARELRRSTLSICFDRSVIQKLSSYQKKEVVFINHLSPLIRWITNYYKEYGHNLSRTSAIFVNIPSLEEGGYVFDIHLWEITGILKFKKLSYGIRNIITEEVLSAHDGETVFKELLQNGKQWNANNYIPDNVIYNNLVELEEVLQNRFGEEVERRQADNDSTYMIREHQIKNISNQRIKKYRETILKLQIDNKVNMIPAWEGRIRKEEEVMQKQLHKLNEMAYLDVQATSVAMGVFINDRSYG